MDRGNSSSPYIPNTDADRQAMLQATGVDSVEALFKDIPARYVRPSLDIPAPLSELELRRELQALSNLNLNTGSTPSFLGGGAYNHFIPSVVGHIASRGELSTSYTPYQPEVAQGTLQITYEFQSLVSQLMSMEVANAGMYDGATALAEAALMACRLTSKERICRPGHRVARQPVGHQDLHRPPGLGRVHDQPEQAGHPGGHGVPGGAEPQLLRLPGGHEQPGQGGPR